MTGSSTPHLHCRHRGCTRAPLTRAIEFDRADLPVRTGCEQQWGPQEQQSSPAASTAGRLPPVVGQGQRWGNIGAGSNAYRSDAEARHEVPGGARRTRRRRGVDGQESAQPPLGAGPRRCHVAGGRRTAARVRLRLRGLQPGQRGGAGRRGRRGPGLRPPAGRDHQGTARQAGRHRGRRRAPGACLRQRTLHVADDARRGLPDPPVPARSTRRRSPRRWPRSRSPPGATRPCR
jgi:hypothetical protein